jgi:hypothetical protein
MSWLDRIGDRMSGLARQAADAGKPNAGAEAEGVGPAAQSEAPEARAQRADGGVRGALAQAGAQLRELRENLGEKLRASVERLQADDGGQSAAGQIGWLKRAEGQPPTRDVSARFDQLVDTAKAGDRTLPPGADDHVYLLVPGLFTERYPGYMDANERRLEELGLDTRRVPVDSDASVEANAKAVRDAILAAAKDGKQVVLIGHSKGGVDTAAALARYPELKPHVRAFVAMQAPYGGSPIAHDASHCPTLRPTVEGFIKSVFRGDPRALGDLGYDARQRFIREHPYPSDIPTVSLATSSSRPASLTAAASAYIQGRYGEGSDGLVPQKDAEIPGSSVVRLNDMDHAAPAMQGPPGLCKYDPGDVTQALVTLALTQPSR